MTVVVMNRRTLRTCSVRKGVFRNFAKFTGKHLCQSLFFMNKEFSKAIMARTRLRNKSLKNWRKQKLHTQQRNHCVSFLRKTERQFYENINKKDFIVNKYFWKIVKLFLSDKTMTQKQNNTGR